MVFHPVLVADVDANDAFGCHGEVVRTRINNIQLGYDHFEHENNHAQDAELLAEFVLAVLEEIVVQRLNDFGDPRENELVEATIGLVEMTL